MAEENTILLVIPEKHESGGSSSGKTPEETPSSVDNGYGILPHDHRESLCSSPDVKNSRRNSTRKPISLEGKQKLVPHYLRASTGSCHDFCKYGRKHAVEVKERRPIRKRITQAPSHKQNPLVAVTPVEKKRTTKALSDEQNPVMTVVAAAPVERKKSTLARHTSSPDIETLSVKHATSPHASYLKDPPEIIKQEVLSYSMNFELSLKQDPSSDKKTPKTEKSMNIFRKNCNPSVQPRLLKPLSSCLPESGKKTPKAVKRMKNLSEKCSPSVRPQPIKAKSSPFFRKPEGVNGRGRRKDDIKTRKTVNPSKKKLLPLTSSLSAARPSISRTVDLKATKDRGLKLMSPLKEQNIMQKAEVEETINNMVPEKTLHVVETETNKSLPESTTHCDAIPPLLPQSSPSRNSMSEPQSSSLSSHEEEEQEDEEEVKEEEEEEEEEEQEEENEYTCDGPEEFVTDKNVIANRIDFKAIEGNQRKIFRKGCRNLESEDSLPVKLKFRRGKVVDPRSENNDPRRLRFRRGRVMEENLERKNEMRRNFKKKEDDGDGNGTKSSDEKVVLRHQDTQGKKDAQGLFNNVIEETASKLVESRKSKVKALVGAFETVISLQDTKPATQTVT